ncbi:hypothetical protein [Rhizobium leguminosarum]|uniref:hypothetical protein n=1 Tax=Rhizobium leguminosarum TaxID=384 RepID=UPI0012FADF71|nr:hypothetical protein [Rhizobium leguminosarum]MVO95508.1 hypothetical protein [Rhizobium leguminosarum bv. phaseoli]
MNKPSIGEFLNARCLELTPSINAESYIGSRHFAMVLSGEAKLPLDRVEEVAGRLRCNKHELFRLAMHQFFDDVAIGLFERMLAQPVSDEEQMWLNEIRSANYGPVSAPSGTSKRLLRALAKAQGPT